MKTLFRVAGTLLLFNFFSISHAEETVPPYAGLYPHGEVFPIGGYSPNPQRDKDAGFSLVGPNRRRADEYLQQCEQLGIPMIYPVGMTKAQLRGKDKQGIFYSREEIRAVLTEQVSRVMDSDMIYAWNLHPEELRYWRSNELHYLQVATEVIREVDPLKRPVWMYEPGHRTQSALEKTLPYLQISGKGVYTNYAGHRENRAWVSWTLDQQNKAIAAVNADILPFAVLEMFRQPDPEHVEMIPTWVRHDSYSALLEGVKGIIIFSMGRRSGFPDRMTYYNAYAEVARELNGELGLGAVFLYGQEEPIPDHILLSGETDVVIPMVISRNEINEVKWPAFKMKSFLWKEHKYLFIVNSSNSPISLKFAQQQQSKPIFDLQPNWGEDGRTLQLPALGVVGFREEIRQ